MWNKTLLAAAVASFALPAAAQDAVQPASPAQTDAPSDTDSGGGDGGVVDSVTVIGHRRDAGFKADDQVSGKLPMTMRETPQSVSVLTRDSLDVRQVFSLQQAFELSAGVTQYSGTGPFAGQPSFGFNQTTIRGIGLDDQYDFRDDGFVSGSFFSVPDLAIYERVEVVKGPNSTLYGRGSVGGLINRIRKKPLGEKRTEIEFSAGSFETWRTDFDTTGPLTETGAVRGRLTAVYEDSGSFVRGVETQRTVLAPSVEADLTPSTRLLVQALHQSEDIIPNTGLALRADGENYEAPDISRRQYNGVPTRDPYAWTIESLSAQLEQGLGDRWLATLRLSASKTDTPIRTDAYMYGFTEGDDPSTPDVVERRGDTTIMGNDFAIDRDIFSTELQLNGAFDWAGREAKVGFGADFNENQYSRRGMYTDGVTANIYDADFVRPDPTLNPGFQNASKPQSTGVYAQTQLPVTDRLKVLLGARYDSVRLITVPSHSLTAPTPATQKETVDDLTARIGLTFDVSEQVSVYGLWAQSFTPELFATDANGNLLAPETGEIFELGTKTEWFDGRLGVSAAVYQVDREDIAIGAETAPGEPSFSVSSGLQRSEGFEVEVNGRPLPGWTLSMAFNHLDAGFEDPRDPFFGFQPGGTADWQMGLYSGYEVQTGMARGLGFGATLYAIDDRGVSAFNVGTIPGYERLDLHAGYSGFQNIEINLLVRNVTDEFYIEGADRPGAIAFLGSPTAALLSVKYTMGAD